MRCNYFDRESLRVRARVIAGLRLVSAARAFARDPPGRGELDLALDVSANCTLNALVIR